MDQEFATQPLWLQVITVICLAMLLAYVGAVLFWAAKTIYKDLRRTK